MKRFFVWILVLGLVFTVGCGDKNVDESTAPGESEVITLGEEDIEILVPTVGSLRAGRRKARLLRKSGPC